jgi:hypothetical protein
MNAKAIRDRFERETGDRLTIHKVRVRDIPNFDGTSGGWTNGGSCATGYWPTLRAGD